VELVDNVGKTSTNELMEEAARLSTVISSSLGSLVGILGELERREAWRAEGATSLAAWLTERCGVSETTGRSWAHVADRLDDLPHLAQGLRVGALSFDKVRAAVELATPETDARVLRQAEECTVRQLRDLVQAGRGNPDDESAKKYQGRYLRFNDARSSLTAQLPKDHYAMVRAAIADRAREFPSDGETRYDQRQCDALIDICLTGGGRSTAGGDTGGSSDADGATGAARSPGSAGTTTGAGSPAASDSRTGMARDLVPTISPGRFFVVAHTDLALLRGGTGTAEIIRLGLLSREDVRRITCDATVALALDDAFGHTMFEGRTRRFPSDTQRREVARRDRRCRFPGCANATFCDVHHIVHWADDGLTDLDNLVMLCDHHHHRMHENRWQVTGNANGVLTFVGPTGRIMTSRPSPLWTKRGQTVAD
jgi:hypothetical protein